MFMAGSKPQDLLGTAEAIINYLIHAKLQNVVGACRGIDLRMVVCRSPYRTAHNIGRFSIATSFSCGFFLRYLCLSILR